MDLALNPVQRQAVEHPFGPLLVLAGAGSGKTRVLTGRVAHLVRDRGLEPQRLLAFTFTNKAAREMHARVERLLGRLDLGIWIGTFHGTCVRILRRHAEIVGLPRAFVIYDTDDQRSLLRSLLRGIEEGSRSLTPAAVGGRISRLKNEGVNPEEYAETAFAPIDRAVSSIYGRYQRALRERGAVDFDDLLVITVRLLELDEDIRGLYAERFAHILVDEYQDTNAIQFRLIELLSGVHRNLMVVGDDDQSIYGWRGADVENILSFERVFPDATILRLTQNYRSTKTILRAANGVVRHNVARKEKELWTENDVGDPVRLHRLIDEESEGERAVTLLLEEQRRHARPNREFVILYRTNAQSRAVENALRRSGIPYQLTGGVSFYERREVKDLVAYLRALVQPRDLISWQRILNVPPRGIGKTTLDRLTAFMAASGLTMIDALAHPGLGAAVGGPAAKKLTGVARLFDSLRGLTCLTPAACVAELTARIRYREYLQDENPAEAPERIENVEELIAGAEAYARRAEDPSLEGFLAEISLLTDVDLWDETEDAVNLMTIHSAKGLEFPVVFVVGMEEGLLPHSSSMQDPRELEEERRLFYVALTRAQSRVHLLQAVHRRSWNAAGGGSSRFLGEIPADCLVIESDETYGALRPAPRGKVGMAPSGAPSPVGERVLHAQFGEGLVVACEGVGSRAKLTVQFGRAGTKKILAAFAEWSHVD